MSKTNLLLYLNEVLRSEQGLSVVIMWLISLNRICLFIPTRDASFDKEEWSINNVREQKMQHEEPDRINLPS